MRNQKILFIVEENVLNGRSYFGASNDLLLIHSALKSGAEIYLTTPQKLIESSSLALKLCQPDWRKLNLAIKLSWKKEVLNSIAKMPANPDNSASKILFENSQWQNIDWSELTVFNRSEPISLTDNFYKTLISLKNNGAKILPDPHLNQILGDKLAVYALHYQQKIANLDLLESVDFKGLENQISFESQIITLSQNTLNGQQIEQFYQLLEQQNLELVENLFADEYKIFKQGVSEYLQFHLALKNDSIIKPVSYFGGVGVVVTKNQPLNFDQAIENIVQSFLAIKKDATQNGAPQLAFLPAIIAQERATHANLGDLRIVICGSDLQGIFVRFNPHFEKFKVGNLHFGGYAKTLFGNYPINKNGVELLIADLQKQGFDSASDQIKQANALFDLLDKLHFLAKIKIFHNYPIIGVDALLTQNKNGDYRYGINEINLTSPMGQVQLIILAIAAKVQKNPDLIDAEIDNYLHHNIADQTIQFLNK
ncbi:MAG: hypothetical protein V4612_02410 [Pseudomonadota bacterium]